MTSRHLLWAGRMPAGFRLNGSAYKYTSASAFSYDVGSYDDSGACGRWAAGLAALPSQPHVVACCHASLCLLLLASLPHTHPPTPPAWPGLLPADMITYNATTQGGINVTLTRSEAMLRLTNLTQELQALRLELEVRHVVGRWAAGSHGTAEQRSAN